MGSFVGKADLRGGHTIKVWITSKPGVRRIVANISTCHLHRQPRRTSSLLSAMATLVRSKLTTPPYLPSDWWLC